MIGDAPATIVGEQMRTAAILPVKRFEAAKSRLGAIVTRAPRERLAGAMVGDVLLALEQTPSVEITIVVTCEPTVLDYARVDRHLLFLEDSAESGQSDAVALGVRRALAEGIERVLCIPGDCPALDPDELEALLAASVPPQRSDSLVVIVPDRHGTGTNGLLMTPPDAIYPSFGPDSCERHRALARGVGALCRVERLPSLLLDVDTGDDLDELKRRLAQTRTERPASFIASGTRSLLDAPAHATVSPIEIG